MKWIDRLTEPFAPAWTLKRMRARTAMELMARYYDAAGRGRRTMGWNRPAGDANAAAARGIRIRQDARDLIRNNAYASAALDTIMDHVVGWGLTLAAQYAAKGRQAKDAGERWKLWAETTACDADGRQTFAGLQKQVMRTVAESGEVLVRRRWRRPEDKLPIPLQLQVLEPDLIDSSKDGITSASGGRIIQGVEFNPIGRPVGLWLFPEHPGSTFQGAAVGASKFVPARDVLHIFRPGRPGQVRGVTWFAPVMLRLKDFDDYEDAALMKQKIAACLAILTTDVEGTAPALGTAIPGATAGDAAIDMLEPGIIANIATGRDVHVVQPPSVSEHGEYSKTILRAVATGLGLSYEDVVGDFTNLPYSAARMSRIRSWARVEDWRWRLLVPQFCDPVWSWAMQAAGVMGLEDAPPPEWTAPPMPMIEPDVQARAYLSLLRIGAITWPEMVREMGYDPEQQLATIAFWNKKLDDLQVVLDSDPRKVSQQGQFQAKHAPGEEGVIPKAPGLGGGGNGASRNGNGHRPDHRDEEIARAFALLEQALSQRAQSPERAPIYVENHMSPPNVTIADGAIRSPDVRVEAPVTVEGATVNVAPPSVRIEEGAVQVSAPVTVAPPEVHVESPVTIAEGAVRVDAPVTVMPPAQPTPPQVTVVRIPKAKAESDQEPTP